MIWSDIVVTAAVTVIASGFASYVGVKVAIAVHAARIKQLELDRDEDRRRFENDLRETNRRVERLEAGYFRAE